MLGIDLGKEQLQFSAIILWLFLARSGQGRRCGEVQRSGEVSHQIMVGERYWKRERVSIIRSPLSAIVF